MSRLYTSIVLFQQLLVSLVDKHTVCQHSNHKQIDVGCFHISREERKNHRTYEPTEEYHSESED